MTQKVYKKTLKVFSILFMCGNIIGDTYSTAFNTAIANPNNTNVTALETALNPLTSATKAFDDSVIGQYFSSTNDLQTLFNATNATPDGLKARTFINDAIKWIFPSISPVVLAQNTAAPTLPGVSYSAFTTANAQTIDDWYTNTNKPTDFDNAVRAQNFINPNDLEALRQIFINDDFGSNSYVNDGQIIIDIANAIAAGIDLNTYIPGTPPAPLATFTIDTLNTQGTNIVNSFFSPTGTVPTDFNDLVLHKYSQDTDGREDIQDLVDMLALSEFKYGQDAITRINQALSPIQLQPSLRLADFVPENAKKFAEFFETNKRVPVSLDKLVIEKFNAENGFIDLRKLVSALMDLHSLSRTDLITSAKLAAERIVSILNPIHTGISVKNIDAFLGLDAGDPEIVSRDLIRATVLSNAQSVSDLKEDLSKHTDLLQIFAANFNTKFASKFIEGVDILDGIAWDRIEEISKHTITQSSIPLLRIYFYLFGALLDISSFEIIKHLNYDNLSGFEDFYTYQSIAFNNSFKAVKSIDPVIKGKTKAEKAKLEMDRDVDIRNAIATDAISTLIKNTNENIPGQSTVTNLQVINSDSINKERAKLLSDFYKKLYNIMILAIQKEDSAADMKEIIEKYLLTQYNALKAIPVGKNQDSFNKMWSNAQVSKLFDLLKLDTEILKKYTAPTNSNTVTYTLGLIPDALPFDIHLI